MTDTPVARAKAPQQPRRMVITLVVESPHSGNHVGGLMLDVFRRPERGVVVDNLRVRVEDRVVVAYDRPGARK